MRSLLTLILAAFLVTGVRADWCIAAPTKLDFRAKVISVESTLRLSGTEIQVAPDPRFVLKVEIEECYPMFRDFQKGDVVSFGIHSTSMLFGADSPVGKSFKFSVSIKYPEGSVRQFRGLEVKKELGEPATTGNAGKTSPSSTEPEARRP